MKKSLLFILAAVFFCACGNQEKYTLQGRLDDPLFEGKTVYLKHGDLLDSTTIAGGQFSFAGTADEPMVGLLQTERLEQGNGYYGTFILEPGEVYIDLVTDSLSGTPRNDFYYSHIGLVNVGMSKIQAEYYMLAQQMGENPEQIKLAMDSLSKAFDVLGAQMKEGYLGLYNENKDNAVGLYAIKAVAETDGMTRATMDSLLCGAASSIAQDSALCAIMERLRNIENTQPGKPFADFSGIDFATGYETTLGAMIEGKVALIDFWASWCRPCRQEITENLLRIHKEYAPKGLEVIGVDVWDQTDKHAQAVKDLGIEYAQLIDTTRTSSHLYGFNGIPFIILVDKDGTILARDIRGEAVEQAVKEALAEKK